MILAAVYLYVRHEKDYQKLKKRLCVGDSGRADSSSAFIFSSYVRCFLCGYILCSFIKEKGIKLKYILPGGVIWQYASFGDLCAGRFFNTCGLK